MPIPPRLGLHALCLALGLLLLAGCAGPPEATDRTLALPADRYEDAFVAVSALLADRGLSPAVRDRRAGVIETDARPGAGWFTPWNLETASTLEDVATFSTVRRRARVTFEPRASDVDAADAAPTAPDLFGFRSPPRDLTLNTDPLDVRIAVHVERTHRPGLRVDTWSRRLVSQARVARPDPGRGFEPARTWWPVARDAGLEAALLEELAERLEAGD